MFWLLAREGGVLRGVAGVNLLLAIVLFGTIVGDMLPVTNTTPLIGQLATLLPFLHSYLHFDCIAACSTDVKIDLNHFSRIFQPT